MSTRFLCQILIIALSIFSLFYTLKTDVEGRDAKEPSGFPGVALTIVSTAIAFTLCYFAGALPWSTY